MASATTYRLQDPSTRWRGLVVVLLLHLLLGWLLLSGTLDKGLDLAKKPPESIVIQEVLIAPPPAPMTPPPRDTKPKPPATKAAPSQTAAPPAAVAPVEMAAPPAAAPTISAVPVAPTTALPVVPPVLAPAVVAAAASMPTVPAAPALAPLAAAPGRPAAPALAPLATVPGTPISSDIGLVCPTQVPPDTPLRARQSGTTGVVVAQATIRNGAVTDVTILSGPAVFHAAVRNAMRQYKCNENADEAVVTQRFVFKLE